MNASDLRHQRRLLHETVDGLALIVVSLEAGLPPDLEEPLAASLSRSIQQVRNELSASLRADAGELAAFLAEIEETFTTGLGEPPAWVMSGLRQWSALLAEPESVDEPAEGDARGAEVAGERVAVSWVASELSWRAFDRARQMAPEEWADFVMRKAEAEDPSRFDWRMEDWTQFIKCGRGAVAGAKRWKEIQKIKRESSRKNLGGAMIDQIPEDSRRF